VAKKRTGEQDDGRIQVNDVDKDNNGASMTKAETQ